jgi:hypothetical protein
MNAEMIGENPRFRGEDLPNVLVLVNLALIGPPGILKVHL